MIRNIMAFGWQSGEELRKPPLHTMFERRLVNRLGRKIGESLCLCKTWCHIVKVYGLITCHVLSLMLPSCKGIWRHSKASTKLLASNLELLKTNTALVTLRFPQALSSFHRCSAIVLFHIH